MTPIDPSIYLTCLTPRLAHTPFSECRTDEEREKALHNKIYKISNYPAWKIFKLAAKARLIFESYAAGEPITFGKTIRKLRGHPQLKEKFQFAIYHVVEKALDLNPHRDRVFDLARLLDLADYSHQNYDDPIYQTIVSRLMTSPDPHLYMKVGFDSKTAAICLFSLRLIKTKNKSELFSFFCNILKDKVFLLSPFETSVTTYGLIKANHQNTDLLIQLKMHTFNNAPHFTQQEAIYTLQAYVFTKKVGASKAKDRFLANNKLVKAFRPTFLKKMEELNETQVIEIASIFNELRLTDPEFFHELGKRFDHHFEQSRISESMMNRAFRFFCEAGGDHDSRLYKMLNWLKSRLDNYDVCDLCTMAYTALTKSCQSDSYDYDAFILDILKNIVDRDFNSLLLSHRHNLKTILAYITLKEKIDADLLERLEKKLGTLQFVKHSQISGLHKNIESYLKPILNPVYTMENEYRFCSYSIDMAIPEKKIAIEIDGWSHFDDFGNLLPKMKLKEKLLKLSGWSVVRIPAGEWPHQKDKRVTYLTEKLKKFDILKTSS